MDDIEIYFWSMGAVLGAYMDPVFQECIGKTHGVLT